MKNVNSQVHEYNNLKKHTPLLHFNENADYNEWKKAVHVKLEELLGLPLTRCDSDFIDIKPLVKYCIIHYN